MSEIKAVSFRLGDEEVQKFREFAEEQGLNQAEMFQALVNNFEVARAKNLISDRAKEIETFQATVNTLVGMFVNSLAVNHSSEERIREYLSVELGTKDKTITDLQERVKELSGQLEMRESHVIALVAEKKVLADSERALTERIAEYKDDIKEKNSLLADYKIQKNLLATMVDEYKPYKEECEARRVKYEELLLQMKNIQNENAALLSKIENISRMKDFYQAQVESMQAEAKEVAKRVVDMDKEYKDTVTALTKQHKSELEVLRQELTAKFNEELNSKIEFEKSKYQLELDKALNREQALQSQLKAKKTTKSAKTTK